MLIKEIDSYYLKAGM